MIKYIKLPFFIALLVALLLSVNSCEKWIETDFPNNQLPTELVFEDEQTAEAALAGLYGALWNNSLIAGSADGTGYFLGNYTDDIMCILTTANNGIVDIFNNQQVPTNTVVNSVWTNAYQQIYTANSIIYGVENSKSLPAGVKDRIRGEALFVRSMLYFYLYQIYGEVPYTDTIDYTFNMNLKRMPKDQFLVRLETDMSEAVNLMPANYRSAERIYPNKAVGIVLLAKMKMLIGKWTEAEVLCQSVLQTSGYVFQNDISKVFQKNGSHIMWQLKPRNNNDPTKEAALYSFTTAPTSYILNVNLVNSFSAGDLRRLHYFTGVTFNGQTNYKSTKYKNISAGSNTTEYSVIFRLEEVHLMLAEVLIQQGKVAEAVPHLNKTRQRAGLTALGTGISVSTAMNELKAEKRREFFAEHGLRFFDLKRWGDLSMLVSVKPNWKAFHQFWPLPQKELLINPNLNPQNDGYQ